MKKILAAVLALAMVFSFTACGSGNSDKTEVYVFIAASLSAPMAELEAAFEEKNPDVDIVLTADSSGTLMAQIEEGAEADIFFSAAQKQMNELEDKGYLIEGTRQDMVANQLCVIAGADSDTECTGIETLDKAADLAIADGSVPAGKYTRQALISLGILDADLDPAEVTTAQLQDVLGVEISEQSNVSKVLSAVAEGASEAGTVYYSDTYGYEDDVKVIQMLPLNLTGDIIYPAARIVNSEADDVHTAAADAFYDFIRSDAAKAVYEKYYMDTDVK